MPSKSRHSPAGVADCKAYHRWGQSAGATSVAMQIVSNGGNAEGLFRAAFMQSGSPIPVGDITAKQPLYDHLVRATDCSGSADTLQCLRTAPFEQLAAAINGTPNLFSFQVLSRYHA